MSEQRLIIPTQKYAGETAVVSVRLPKSMLARLEAVAAKTGRSRNEIMLLSMEFALEHIEIGE